MLVLFLNWGLGQKIGCYCIVVPECAACHEGRARDICCHDTHKADVSSQSSSVRDQETIACTLLLSWLDDHIAEHWENLSRRSLGQSMHIAADKRAAPPTSIISRHHHLILYLRSSRKH